MKYIMVAIMAFCAFKWWQNSNLHGSGILLKRDLGTAFELSGDGTISEIKFSKEANTNLELFVFSYREAQGHIDQFGADIELSYLVPEKMDTFKNKYQGDLRRCPASFLNRNTAAIRLIGANEQVSKALQAIDIEGREYGVHFNLSGAFINYQSGTTRQGQPLNMRMSPGLKFFLVDQFSLN